MISAKATDIGGMTELFIAFAVAGALLCWRHAVKPFGRVLELGDDLDSNDLDSEERSATPGAGPREAPTELVLPPK